MSSNIQDLDSIAADSRRRIGAAADEPAVEQLRIELLGKKGTVTAALRSVGSLPAEQRAAAGARANALKGEIEQWLLARLEQLKSTRLETIADREWVDVSFVPNAVRRGHLHPLTLILREVKAIFSRIGYEVALGPQVDDEFHNFEALNIPAEHPRGTRWTASTWRPTSCCSAPTPHRYRSGTCRATSHRSASLPPAPSTG